MKSWKFVLMLSLFVGFIFATTVQTNSLAKKTMTENTISFDVGQFDLSIVAIAPDVASGILLPKVIPLNQEEPNSNKLAVKFSKNRQIELIGLSQMDKTKTKEINFKYSNIQKYYTI